MALMTTADAIAAMRVEVAQHLVECCEELIESSQTGILRSGRVRAISSALQRASDIPGHDVRSIVPSEVALQAMKKVRDDARDAAAREGT